MGREGGRGGGRKKERGGERGVRERSEMGREERKEKWEQGEIFFKIPCGMRIHVLPTVNVECMALPRHH